MMSPIKCIQCVSVWFEPCTVRQYWLLLYFRHFCVNNSLSMKLISALSIYHVIQLWYTNTNIISLIYIFSYPLDIYYLIIYPNFFGINCRAPLYRRGMSIEYKCRYTLKCTRSRSVQFVHCPIYFSSCSI